MPKQRKSRIPVFLTVAPILLGLLAIITGCGGSGGESGCVDSSVVSSLEYRTEWSGSTGQSQLIQLLTEGGDVLQSRILNRGVVQTSFVNVSSGSYRVRSELRELADGAGAVLGRLDASVAICRTTNLSVRTGGAPTAVRVSPSTATTFVGSSIQFRASAVNNAGEYFFTTPNTLQWAVTQGGGTVDSSGLFQAVSAGPNAVQATDPGNSVTGSTAISVQPFTPVQGKWTILVFLNAANDLNPFSVLNINQMERVAGNADVRFVVQWKQSQAVFPGSSFDGTRRLLVRPDTSNQIQSPTIQQLPAGTDMGSWTTLREFIQWGKANFPADRYGLVVWNHGNGWQRGIEPPTRAVSYDDQTGNSIQIWELPDALQGEHFDLIAWDASLMQMTEVAYEVAPFCDYIIGSEESPPGEGYPYDKVFRAFRDTPDQTTRNLARGFVDETVSHPPFESRKITQSVLDSTKIAPIAAALDLLAAELIANVGTIGPIVTPARNNAQSYSPTFLRTYRDLWHLAELIRLEPAAPPGVKSRAAEVQAALLDAIVWEGHNANSPNSHGLAIDFSRASTFTSIDSDYQNLKLAEDTQWDEWLRVAP